VASGSLFYETQTQISSAGVSSSIYNKVHRYLGTYGSIFCHSHYYDGMKKTSWTWISRTPDARSDRAISGRGAALADRMTAVMTVYRRTCTRSVHLLIVVSQGASDVHGSLIIIDTSSSSHESCTLSKATAPAQPSAGGSNDGEPSDGPRPSLPQVDLADRCSRVSGRTRSRHQDSGDALPADLGGLWLCGAAAQWSCG